MWTCVFLENPPMASFEHEGKVFPYVDTRQLKVGTMWFARDEEGTVLTPEKTKLERTHLTQHYWSRNSHRPPIIVLLPCKYSTGEGVQEFCIDQMCYGSGRGHYDGWTVEGTPPQITVSPSINIQGSYHGWLKDGVISQDVDGRNYTLPT